MRNRHLTAIGAALYLASMASIQAHEPGEKAGSSKGRIVAPPATPQIPQAPGTEGTWTTLPYLMTINPIHVSVLHTGKVLIVSGSENERGNSQQGEYYGGVWDPAAGTVTVQNLEWDVFCTGMAALPDGRFVIVGGTANYQPFEGLFITTVFDPLTEKFAQLEDMAHGRWYGSSIILNDGRLMAYSGLDENGNVNQAVQFYQAGVGWSPELISPLVPSLYPRMHMLPTGNVFVSGTVPRSSMFHPDTQTWDAGVAKTVLPQNRKGGASVLLPLRPENGYDARVIILGGMTPATKTCEIIDFANPTPAWHSTAPMVFPRIRLNAVLLPTGKVLALGGSYIDEDGSTASLNAEIFDPTTETWTSAGKAVYPRLYHSSALLLPDATVWVAGSNPKDVWEEHMEIYTPAYLFNSDGTPATRPTITSVPAKIGYGASFQIETPNSADIRDVVLMRPGSSTHSFDFEQRVIGLTYSTPNQGQIEAIAPPGGLIAPPGYYMVFIINQAGVPSVAQFIHLSSDPNNQPPSGTITAPTSDLTIDPGESVDFASTASDPDGTIATYKWVFPGGTPATSTSATPGLVRFDEGGTYVVSMTATDNAGANDPSPPTRTITVRKMVLDATITQPPADSNVSGRKVPITVSVSGTEEGTANTFTVKVDSTEIGTRTFIRTEATFNWTTASFAPGLHTITATVRDYEGHEGTATEQVTLVR